MIHGTRTLEDSNCNLPITTSVQSSADLRLHTKYQDLLPMFPYSSHLCSPNPLKYKVLCVMKWHEDNLTNKLRMQIFG